MTTRPEFIARVRSGLNKSGQRGTAAGAAPEINERIVRLTTADRDLASQFAARAARTGMTVHRCGSGELAQTLSGLVRSFAAKTVVLDHLEPELLRTASDVLARSGANVVVPATARNLDVQFDSVAGVTGVVAAIAETGTLVMVSDHLRSRGTFMIPPVHIAIFRESQILPDMLDLWGAIGRKPPTAVTLVTGPSKTADIEGILVTGVHGPRAVHVVLVSSKDQVHT